MEVRLRFLETGSCTHPERTILPHGSWKPLRFPAMVAVIEHPREGVILFDTGYPADFELLTRSFPEKLYALATPTTIDAGNIAIRQLERLGIQDADVRSVISSHFHADHIGGLRDFTRCTYLHDPEGFDRLKDLSRIQGVRRGFLKKLIPADFESRTRAIQSMGKSVRLEGLGRFSEGRDLFDDGSVVSVPLPGHAAGQLGLRVRSAGQTFFLVSDACWVSEAFEKNILPAFITRLLMDDFRAYGRTLQALHELSRVNPEIRIVPCHCERANRDAAQWLARGSALS